TRYVGGVKDKGVHSPSTACQPSIHGQPTGVDRVNSTMSRARRIVALGSWSSRRALLPEYVHLARPSYCAGCVQAHSPARGGGRGCMRLAGVLIVTALAHASLLAGASVTTAQTPAPAPTAPQTPVTPPPAAPVG